MLGKEEIVSPSLDELKELRGQLNEKLNNHPYTKELDEIIANKEFKVGVEAPEFSIKGMDGEDIELTLNDEKGSETRDTTGEHA